MRVGIVGQLLDISDHQRTHSNMRRSLARPLVAPCRSLSSVPSSSSQKMAAARLVVVGAFVALLCAGAVMGAAPVARTSDQTKVCDGGLPVVRDPLYILNIVVKTTEQIRADFYTFRMY